MRLSPVLSNTGLSHMASIFEIPIFPCFLRLVTSSFRVVLLDSRNSIRERALIYQKKEVYDTF
ncbi:hypothetical protein LFML04_1153 [Leptospirillum ferriphilum ML-04]|jgi:hypothetical protein|uniref:Uncharacterized protein n=1 Tax=Leptospirillum ferriphilum (strain ML-04) TaxID=1048260 RepID=J9ZB69_LEPFM|nr:hypothetical protein LFML04_1153 [Leptospirillum ferriphilum ML-04]